MRLSESDLRPSSCAFRNSLRLTVSNVLVQDQADAEPSQRRAARIEEHRHRLSRWQAALLNEPLQKASGFGPQWTGPFFLPFASETNTARSHQTQVARLYAHDFADAGTSVEHQAQKGQIATAIPVVGPHRLQHGLDFVRVKVFDRTRPSAFERNAQDALGLFQMADIQTQVMLKLPVPDLRGGKPTVISAPCPPELKEIVQSLVERAEALRTGRIDPREDNMLLVTTDGRKAALDLRLHDPSLTDAPLTGPQLILRAAAVHTAKVTDTALGTIRSVEHAIQTLDEVAADVERTIAETQKRITDLTA